MKLLWFLFSFKGRIARSQWWAYFVAHVLIGSCLLLATGSRNFADSDLTKAYVLFMAYPTLAVNAKRCHDYGYSGWLVLLWVMMPPIGIVAQGAVRGKDTPNEYGPCPGAAETAVAENTVDAMPGASLNSAYTKSRLPIIILGSILIVVITVVLGWQFSNRGPTPTYTTTLAELRRMGDKAFTGSIRLGGVLEPGSIRRVGSSIQFVLVQDNERLRAIYAGMDPLPDTFRDGTPVSVEGTLDHDGTFRATRVHLSRQ